MNAQRPIIVSIVGGSGAGKTWLSHQIAAAFPTEATEISLDDFYFDRSHVSPDQRRLVNYDHPEAIEWGLLREFLENFRGGRPAHVPRYDFSSHCRNGQRAACTPTRLLIVDGLWLLTQQDVRELFDLSIFLECPTQVRLERRLTRDVIERGRHAEDVREIFERVVAPMHTRHVAPQRRWATVVLHDPVSEADLEGVVSRVCKLLHGGSASDERPVLVAGLSSADWRSAA
jgi:uridine kinase